MWPVQAVTGNCSTPVQLQSYLCTKNKLIANSTWMSPHSAVTHQYSLRVVKSIRGVINTHIGCSYRWIFIFRRDSEVPLEVGKSSQGDSGNNEDDMLKCRWCLVFHWASTFLLFQSFLIHSISSAPIPPPMSIHSIQNCSKWQRRSFCGLDTTASRRNQLWQFVCFSFRLYKCGRCCWDGLILVIQ